MVPPCKNCPRRSELCHGNCDDYKAYRSERDEIIKKMRDGYWRSGRNGKIQM